MICHILNGRPWNRIDAEHGGCNMYLGVSRTKGGRSCNTPNLSAPHCHPAMTGIPYPPGMVSIFKQATTTYEKMMTFNTWMSPPCAMRYSDEMSEPCCKETGHLCTLPPGSHVIT